jgi:hypothetical protein
MHRHDEAQKGRSPDLLQQDGASGIEVLPDRINRYGLAKNRALDVAQYIGQVVPGKEAKRVAAALGGCGEYLLFRHYFQVDQVKLHAAQFCRRHLLCQLCAIRRGAKLVQSYLDRFQVITAADPLLRPFLVTLTVKDGADLAERFAHLYKGQRELWMRVHRKRGPAAFRAIDGAVWSYEAKRGQGSGLWHPHLHMIALSKTVIDHEQLRSEWHDITGDSFIVDVRPIDQEDPVTGFLEVFKYALKFSDMEPADTVHAWQTLGGRRLIGSAGAFRGVEVPDELTDAPLDDQPFTELLFRFLAGGYTLKRGLGR